MDKRYLVERCQSGDREALGILYQTYLMQMREVVSRYIHDADIAQDVLHDGFLIAFRSIGSLNNGVVVEAWLTKIMKNLSLQYLRGESKHMRVEVSDVSIADDTKSDIDVTHELTWEELDNIICMLPKGYGRVFRLFVLEGLSHKEIGAMLGIAPHSSSSQLTRAKSMLRRMIIRYRMEMGMISVIAIILFVWNDAVRRGGISSLPEISRCDEGKTNITDTTRIYMDRVTQNVQNVCEAICEPKPAEHIAEVEMLADTLPAVGEEPVSADTVRSMPNVAGRERLVAHGQSLHEFRKSKSVGWSLSLAYSGSLGQYDVNRYGILNDQGLDAPSGLPEEIEVTEKSHHYMPLVFGLSLNRRLTSRWSLEAGGAIYISSFRIR